jgi:hemerythrin
MSYFEWDRKYEIGVTRMDDQHRKLIQLMDRLHTESDSHAKREKLLNTLDELGGLTTKHFQEEEQFMASIGYSGLASHHLIHAQLLKTYAEHVAEFRQSSQSKIPSSFFTFLKLWLSAHIMGIDTRYAAATRQDAVYGSGQIMR